MINTVVVSKVANNIPIGNMPSSGIQSSPADSIFMLNSK
jgi:hypothetical protein